MSERDADTEELYAAERHTDEIKVMDGRTQVIHNSDFTKFSEVYLGSVRFHRNSVCEGEKFKVRHPIEEGIEGVGWEPPNRELEVCNCITTQRHDHVNKRAVHDTKGR